MSYTTQKEFFNVPFRNEDPKLPERKRSDGALMTYDLCTDGRAWALDKQKRSNYILDVVHKARFKKALLNPEGQFELTKDYLIHLDVDDLADYILSLQSEIKRKNDSVQKLEVSRGSLAEQLETMQKQSNELTEIQHQSVILEQERNDFEQQMEDLEMVIVNLKDRADRYDLLAKENEMLRQQLQKQRVEVTDRMRLINAEAEANFNRMLAKDYEKLEAELIVFKAQYEDLRQQKRELKEQLQKAFVQQSKLTDLKRQLAMEQGHREKVEDELEHVLSLYDQRFQEVDREIFPAIEELEAQRSERWLTGEEVEAQKSFHSGDSDRSSASAELVVETCDNCKKMANDLEKLRRVQNEELQERESHIQALQEQVESLKNELDLVQEAAGGDEQSHKLIEELKKSQEEVRIQKEKEQEAQSQMALLEKSLAQLETKLAEETKKTEQLEAAAKTVVTMNAEPQESEADEIINLQKLLKDAQAELTQKADQLDILKEENTRLQSAVVQHQENIDKLQVTQQQQLIAVEQSKSELAQTKEQMTLLGGAELDVLKKLNDDLQQEVARLKVEGLATAQSMSRGAIENAECQAKLLNTIETLRAELKSANETVKDLQAQSVSRGAIESAESQAEQLKTIGTIRAEVQSATETVEDLAAQSVSRGAMESAESQAKLLMTIETLQAELESATETVEDLAAAQSVSRSVIKSTENQAELVKTIEKLQAELQSTNETVEDLAAQSVSRDAMESAESQAELLNTIETLRAEVRSATETVEDLAAAQSVSRAAIESAESQAKLLKTIETLRTNLECATETVENLTAAQSVSRGAMKSSESQAKLLKTIDTIRAELENATETMEDLAATQSVSRAVMKSAESQAELLKTIETLRAELLSATKTVEDLVAAQSVYRGAMESAMSKAELLKTIETLRAELQSANKTTKEREKVIGKLEAEAEAIISVQPLGGVELSKAEAEAKQLKVVIENERQKLVGRIEELEEKLRQCEGGMDHQKRSDVVDDGTAESGDEGEDQQDIAAIELEETLESGAGMLRILHEEVGQQRASMKGVLIDVGDQDQDQLESIIAEGHRANVESATSDVEHIDEQISEAVGEDVREAGEDDKVGAEERTEKNFEKRRSCVADELSQEQRAQLEQNGFMDDDIIRIGISDPEKIRMIAIKIVRHGICVLVIAELDHLHREICRAIIERYLMLGQNVKAVDKAMYECRKILDTVKKMGNSEMKGMLATPATQVPIRNPLLLDDDIPVRLPAKPKARPKSTSFASGQGPNGLKAPGRVLVGEYDDRFREPMMSSQIPPKSQGRVLVGNGDVCRTRPWRAPKTPTETIVSSTLVDGSRVVARQKRYT